MELADFVGSATLVARTVTFCAAEIQLGGVYNPLALIVPSEAGLMLQVTAVFVAPLTLAANCCVCPTPSVTVPGVMLTATEDRVKMAIPDLLLSATLVAVTTTVWGLLSAPPAAVNKPLALMLPALVGLIDHVTLVLAMPVTVAVNCCVPTWPNVTANGETVIVTGGGVKVNVAVPDFVLSPTLVAVIVTVCCVLTLAGALYSPLALIDPAPVGLMLHVTLVLAIPATLAANCWLSPPPNETAAGATVTVTGGGFSVTMALADLLVSATLVAVTVTVCCAVSVVGAV